MQPEPLLLTEILHDLPVGVWVAKAPGGEFVYANRAFKQVLGIEVHADQAAGTYSSAYRIHRSDGSLYPEPELPFSRVVRERRPLTVDDIVIHRPDASRAYVRAMGKPIFDAGGELSHVLVAFIDITRQVQAEGAQRRGEQERAELLAGALRARDQAALVHERLLGVVNHAPVIVFAMDRSGRIHLAEGRVLSDLGISAAQLIGKTVEEVSGEHPTILRNVARAIGGESFVDSVELGGMTFETWFGPLAGPDGGMLGVATDVTDRRRMQATLLASERMVSVGTIAASVAHEINNPLSYVLACLDFVTREGAPVVAKLETLQQRYPDDVDVADLFATIKRLREPFANIRDGVERMRLIARDLKTFARADDHESSPVDVREVLKSSIRMASNETRYRATVVTELEEVPWVMASEPRLAQVFLNLLVNAAQAFPEDRAPHTCVIRLSTQFDQKGTVAIEVRDNGTGMTAEVFERIFDPFFTTKPVGVGTGLGLAVCRNIVESFGGNISATTTLGRGSSFVVSLPACPGTYRRVRRTGASADSTPAPRAVRVLVIDDDQVLGNAFRLTLSHAYQVRVANSGAEGLELLLRDGPFDFVFCDLMMPNMTGMDVFDELTRLRPDLAQQMLFMTGGAFNREVREFISRVPNACFQKPFDPGAVIREALAQGSLASV